MSIIFYIAIIIVSVIIHEISHGYMAERLGDPTARMAGRLTLNPIAHLDPIGSVILPAILAFSGLPVLGWAKPVPYNPYNLKAGKWGPGLVAIAGPTSNIIVAVFFAIIIRLNMTYVFFSPSFNAAAFVIISLNVLLAIFNMVPIPPLDGSKVLMSVLPYRLSRQIEATFERFGLILIFAVIFLGGQFLFVATQFVVRLLVGV